MWNQAPVIALPWTPPPPFPVTLYISIHVSSAREWAGDRAQNVIYRCVILWKSRNYPMYLETYLSVKLRWTWQTYNNPDAYIECIYMQIYTFHIRTQVVSKKSSIWVAFFASGGGCSIINMNIWKYKYYSKCNRIREIKLT
jgi:hypothetical protein